MSEESGHGLSLDEAGGPFNGATSWARPGICIGPEANLVASAEPVCLVKSKLYDSEGFLSALGMISTRPDLMLALFESVEHLHQGLLSLRLCDGARWVTVPINDTLPCGEAGELLCSRSATPSETCVSLIEKAYAAFLGGYSHLAGEGMASALVAMTGGSVHSIVLGEHPMSGTELSLVSDIREALGNGDVVALHMTARQQAIHTLAGRATHGLRAEERYTVRAVAQVGKSHFLRLHTPWAQAPWQGPWSVGSNEWSTELDKSRQLRSHSFNTNSPNEWWLEASFLALFDELLVCRLFRDAPHRVLLSGAWTAETAGGAPAESKDPGDTSMWVTNPQFSLSLADARGPPVRVTVSLMLARRPTTEEDTWVSVHLFHVQGKARVWAMSEKALVASCGPQSGREHSFTFMAKPREQYTLVPSTLVQGQEGAFMVRVWAQRPCHLEPLKPLQRTFLEGGWSAGHAGGPRRRVSWATNPQYRLACSRRANMLIVLERDDTDAMEGPPSPSGRSLQGLGDTLTSEPRVSETPGPSLRGAPFEPGEAKQQPSGVGMAVVRMVPVESPAAANQTKARARPGLSRHLDDFVSAAAPVERRPLRGALSASDSEVVGEVQTVSAARCHLTYTAGLRGVATHSRTSPTCLPFPRRVNIDGTKPHLLVPNLLAPSEEGRFRITIYCGVGLSATPISDEQNVVIHGAWKVRPAPAPAACVGASAHTRISPLLPQELTACGSHLDYWTGGTGSALHNTPQFLNNPQYQLRVTETTPVRITIRRGKIRYALAKPSVEQRASARATERYYASMMGMYVFRGTALRPGERLRSQSSGAQLELIKMLPFTPLADLECTLTLDPTAADRPYVILPCLFARGLQASFVLEVSSSAADVDVSAADDPAA